MVKTTEFDVYQTLSYHVWKAPLEIRDELREKRGIRRETIFGPDVNLGAIYVHLNHLEEQGFCEYRLREYKTPEELKQLMIREENRAREYRLTSLGIKNRGKYHQNNAYTCA